MEAGRSLVSSSLQFPLRSHLRNRSSSSTRSVLLLRKQVTPALTTLSTTSLTPHPPTSILIKDQCNDSRPFLCLKEDNTFRKTLDGQLALSSSSHDGSDDVDPNQHVNDIELQLLCRPELRLVSLQKKEIPFVVTAEPILSKSEDSTCLEADHVVALAREAFSAAEKAMSIAKHAKILGVDIDDSSRITGLASDPVRRIVRSTRLLERQSKRRRRVPKQKVEFEEINHHSKPGSHRKHATRFDPLRLFLPGTETTELLTAKEEAELIMKIQDLMKLQEVKTRLHAQLSCEPTIVEWAAAFGISCQSLKSHIHIGNISRQKLIYANFRMVVHIAMKYQGRGLNLQELLQENVYALLTKVYKAKKICFQQGNHNPSTEDIAACAGISVERMVKLLQTSREPLSMQNSVWMDEDTTFQEITADTTIDTPDMGVTKQLMRQQVWNLLSVLNPRERKIMQLRFGLDDGRQKTLSEIGDGLGLTKQRVGQLESLALYKLKQCLDSQGLEAYADMLI